MDRLAHTNGVSNITNLSHFFFGRGYLPNLSKHFSFDSCLCIQTPCYYPGTEEEFEEMVRASQESRKTAKPKPPKTPTTPKAQRKSKTQKEKRLSDEEKEKEEEESEEESEGEFELSFEFVTMSMEAIGGGPNYFMGDEESETAEVSKEISNKDGDKGPHEKEDLNDWMDNGRTGKKKRKDRKKKDKRNTG